MQTIVSKTSQKEFNKREILLVDEKASISVTLWGQQVNLFLLKYLNKKFICRQKSLMGHQILLLLLKELKLETLMVCEKMKYDKVFFVYFLGRTLSCLNGTLICHDPTETPRTVELRVWFDNEGKSMDLPDLSKGADIGNRQSLFTSLMYHPFLCLLFQHRLKLLLKLLLMDLGLGINRIMLVLKR
jgi:hypothetical protein